jgi:hypothetical protein
MVTGILQPKRRCKDKVSAEVNYYLEFRCGHQKVTFEKRRQEDRGSYRIMYRSVHLEVITDSAKTCRKVFLGPLWHFCESDWAILLRTIVHVKLSSENKNAVYLDSRCTSLHTLLHYFQICQVFFFLLLLYYHIFIVQMGLIIIFW